VTAKTYDSRLGGRVGSFEQAVTPADANGLVDRPLQILQLEESDRFRTNFGIAEVSGKAASVEVSAIIPEAKFAPILRLNLAADEFRQTSSILKQMGLSNVYNVRLAVKVVAGEGRVTAYGSVVNNETQDPYNVPGQ